MSPDATPDPYANPMAFGQRMQMLRERRGMTRQELAGLLGETQHWVKNLESGRTQAPSVETVYRIAETLRVRDLADLTGRPDMQFDLFIGPGHPRLAAVREAVDSFGLASSQQAPSAAHIAARIRRAWSARHSAPNHREVVGELLPGLIRDAQLAVKQAQAPADWRAAQAVLAEVYSLAQFFLAYQPDSSLLWRAAERSMVAAQQSDDPHTVGVSAWLLTQAHRDSGRSHYDAADAVNRQALALLEPLLADAGNDVLAIAGALQFEAGYTAARRGETATAWRYWDTARSMASRLPEDYFHPVTSFSRAIMGAHAVTVAVELHSGSESVRQAARSEANTIPSRPRRARHRIEQARGYHLDGQPEAAIATLNLAYEAAPETIRYNGYARTIVLEQAESKVTARRRRASELAVKIGLLAA
ncbi:helix-turn-helix domain-containing protein [Streptomyces sp. NPDC014870]|uniref:helix-turn-helix domain-containing protein n=1 Tax=Streptomyces sp. NPDC014870 TaxID=3364925 RepID=UPI0036FC50BF